MAEDQNTEWKEQWRDEYLKTVCAFANTNGGTLDVGRNDLGTVIGVQNPGRLLEDIPSKLRNILGITVDVRLLKENNLPFIRISVNGYHNPISYRNQYYRRSGSTTSALTGNDLNQFLIDKFGLTWEDVIVPDVKISDLSLGAFDLFRKKARQKKRISPEALNVDNLELLDKLKLVKNDQITRAGVLLFHDAPERYFTNAFTKIGFFATDADLLYHDIVEGNLFSQLDKVLDFLFTKYTKAYIRYEGGVQRIEEMPFPREAMREVVTNAIVHKDYSIPATTQIRVYDDKFIVYNDGKLPDSITIDMLNQSHRSIPRNPNIANTLFLTGGIESWGRGTNQVFAECAKYGIGAPVFETKGTMVSCTIYGRRPSLSEKTVGKESEKGRKRPSEKMLGKTKSKILSFIRNEPEITIGELSKKLNLTTRTIERHLSTLQEQSYVQRVGGRKEGHWEIL